MTKSGITTRTKTLNEFPNKSPNRLKKNSLNLIFSINKKINTIKISGKKIIANKKQRNNSIKVIFGKKCFNKLKRRENPNLIPIPREIKIAGSSKIP